MSRQFNSAIFMGNGERSKTQVTKLHGRLNEALTMLSGLQQPPMSTDKPQQDDGRDELQQQLDEAIDDICKALGRVL